MALLYADQQAEELQILEWGVWRWAVEVIFPEGRAHLGVETQRHWSDLAIARTTPADARLAFHWWRFLLSSCWGSNLFLFVRRPGMPKLADLFGDTGLRSSTVVALQLFFGVVLRRRHHSPSTDVFRSPREDPRFCSLSRTDHPKIWKKSTSEGRHHVLAGWQTGSAHHLLPAAPNTAERSAYWPVPAPGVRSATGGPCATV